MSLLRDAIRSLPASPGTSLLIVLALALGTAANSAVFSVVDAVLVRSLQALDPERLVRVYEVAPDGTPGFSDSSSFPVYADHRDQSRSFALLAAYDDSFPVYPSLAGKGAHRLTGGIVTGSFFPTLGVAPPWDVCLVPKTTLALLLAGSGLFGLVAYDTEGRTREIGVRVVLGARPRDVLRLVLGHSLGLALGGLALGLCPAAAAAGLIGDLLFGVAPADRWNLLAVAGVLVLTAVVASHAPARRALRFDPVIALRSE